MGFEGAGGAGDFGQERAGAVEVSVVNFVFCADGCAGEEGDPAAGLEGCFHEDGEGHGVGGFLVEIPCVLGDVVFEGDGGADAFDVWGAVEVGGAGEEVEWVAGQAWHAAGAVEDFVVWAHGVAGFAEGASEHGVVVVGVGVAVVGGDGCGFGG